MRAHLQALLDGKMLPLVSDELITPNTVQKVEGEGMPVLCPEDPLAPISKGDLYVKFDISFPQQLTDRQRGAWGEWSTRLL